MSLHTELVSLSGRIKVYRAALRHYEDGINSNPDLEILGGVSCALEREHELLAKLEAEAERLEKAARNGGGA